MAPWKNRASGWSHSEAPWHSTSPSFIRFITTMSRGYGLDRRLFSIQMVSAYGGSVIEM
jgi:hypothetical protein